MKDLQYFKNALKAILDKQEREESVIAKAFSIVDMATFQKSKGFDIDTIREWKEKKYKKCGDGKWRRVYNSEGKGTAIASAYIKKEIDKATSGEELMRIALKHRGRFSDEYGAPLPILAELRAYIDNKQDFIDVVAKMPTSEKVAKNNLDNGQKVIDNNDGVGLLMDAKAIKRGWRNTRGLQSDRCDTIDGLMATVGASRKEFSDISEGVKAKFQDVSPILLKRKTLKSVARIKEKLREDERGYKDFCKEKEKKCQPKFYDKATDTYHCRTIRDCDGHTLCVKNLQDVEKLLKHYDKQSCVVRIKNNFAKPSPLGYSDINMNIKLSNGAIVEMQLNTTANLVAKERYGHALYEVWRSVKNTPKHKRLAVVMANAQKVLYKLANEYSIRGNFPDVSNGDIYDENYKHDLYAKAIERKVQEAIPLFEDAVKDGALNEDTIKHFRHLCDYIR